MPIIRSECGLEAGTASVEANMILADTYAGRWWRSIGKMPSGYGVHGEEEAK